VVAFGLIHSFGFSSALGELVSDRRALVESLIGFNLRVEIGQLAIVRINMLPGTFMRGSTLWTVIGAAVTIGGLGLLGVFRNRLGR